jgi:hypothetical protein
MTSLEPVQLTGDLVVLDPLSIDDHDALVEATTDGEPWILTYTGVPAPKRCTSAIDRYLAQQANATMTAFTVRRRDSRTGPRHDHLLQRAANLSFGGVVPSNLLGERAFSRGIYTDS